MISNSSLLTPAVQLGSALADKRHLTMLSEPLVTAWYKADLPSCYNKWNNNYKKNDKNKHYKE